MFKMKLILPFKDKDDEVVFHDLEPIRISSINPSEDADIFRNISNDIANIIAVPNSKQLYE